MKKKIRLMIVDDHSLIVEGIRSLLANSEGIEIVAECTNGKDAVEKAIQLVPDVIFMDISMPGTSGIEACAGIKKQRPEINVIALSQHEDEVYVHHFLQAGGSGYMLKSSAREEFLAAIHCVLEGGRFFSSRLSAILISGHFDKRDAEIDPADHPVHLTYREMEILRLVAEGLTNHQVSNRLHISLRTVETHRRNILQKLNLTNAVSLVKYAMRHGIIGLSG